MTLKVLVIDDHPLVQEGVSAALETLADNVTVMSARDGEQGLGLAAENPDLDLVLLDLALPGISGFNLIGKLHEKLPSLPVVVLSALEDPENVRHAINAGAIIAPALMAWRTFSGSSRADSTTTGSEGSFSWSFPMRLNPLIPGSARSSNTRSRSGFSAAVAKPCSPSRADMTVTSSARDSRAAETPSCTRG